MHRLNVCSKDGCKITDYRCTDNIDNFGTGPRVQHYLTLLRNCYLTLLRYELAANVQHYLTLLRDCFSMYLVGIEISADHQDSSTFLKLKEAIRRTIASIRTCCNRRCYSTSNWRRACVTLAVATRTSINILLVMFIFPDSEVSLANKTAFIKGNICSVTCFTR
ncbi:hypothetical protein CEXT_18971 [Caerostris extrusa]|uniref:Uncharacterized protein n=1 Tax=Caerostris extrusa TaxID=172846 RepID=A0AAV4XT73_CAEEX|nr:hypothetical protein CEXT_18971 [Caerostris extrusa]